IEREVAKSRMEKPVKVRARRLSGIPLSTSHHIDNATYSRGKTDYRSEISRNLLIGGLDGGRGGIRTPDTLSGMPVFKTGAINHSATLPLQSMINDRTPHAFRALPASHNAGRRLRGQRGMGSHPWPARLQTAPPIISLTLTEVHADARQRRPQEDRHHHGAGSGGDSAPGCFRRPQCV